MFGSGLYRRPWSAALLLVLTCACQAKGTSSLVAEHLKRGHALFDEGKYPRAHIAFDRARELDPANEDAALYADLSSVAFAAAEPQIISDANINELDYAIDYLRGRFPAQGVIFDTARGNLLARAGKNDEALASYRKALDTKQDYLPALYFMAQILARTDKSTDAEAALRIACKTDPHHVGVRELLARIQLGRKDYDQALATLGEALQAGAGARTHALYGDVATAAGKLEAAETAYREALKLDPNDVAALSGFGDLLMKEKKSADAVTLYSRYLEVAPGAGEPSERISRARMIVRQLSAPVPPPPPPPLLAAPNAPPGVAPARAGRP